MPSIVKFLIVPISLLASKTRALLAVAVPGVTPSKTPISAVVIVVVSKVKDVSPVIVPVTSKSPVEVSAPNVIPASVPDTTTSFIIVAFFFNIKFPVSLS